MRLSRSFRGDRVKHNQIYVGKHSCSLPSVRQVTNVNNTVSEVILKTFAAQLGTISITDVRPHGKWAQPVTTEAMEN